MDILTATRVTKRFGGLVAVNDVDLAVPERGICSIIGPNGAGKTTFFNCISGFYRPEEGELHFNGALLNELRPDEITALGITRTYQNIRLFHNMTALENVLAGQHPHLRSGVAETIFHWLPYGPQTTKGRVLELAALLSTVMIWFAGAWLIIAQAGGTLSIPALVLAILAGVVGLPLWIWGIVLLVRWVIKAPYVRRALERAVDRASKYMSPAVLLVVAYGLAMWLSLVVWLLLSIFPPLVYLVASRLQAKEEGQTMTIAEEEKESIRKATELLNFVGLSGKGDWMAKNLPYGDQRRLEVARALASGPKLLLLDEPTAGMNPAETEAMIQFIRRLRDELGITILLIEHDMKVVMEISEHITVLDYGIKICEGTPTEVQCDPRVIEAYLGTRGGE